MDDIKISCGQGWAQLYNPIVKKIVTFDNAQTDVNKKMLLEEVSSECGGLAFKFQNENNIPDEIKNDIFTAYVNSLTMCELCGTTENVGTTQNIHMITCCKKCFLENIFTKNPHFSWKSLSLTDENIQNKHITSYSSNVMADEKNKVESVNNDNVSTNNTETLDVSIAPTIMIFFGEFLGYVSPLVEYADAMCSGQFVSESIKKAMKVDAHVIYNLMRQDYTDAELNEWFAMYYEAYLADREAELAKYANAHKTA